MVQAGDVTAVVAALPEWLRERMSETQVTRVAAAVPAELDQRTTAQLVERVTRRGVTGWQHEVRDPVGFGMRLIRALRCPDPRCEDGTSIDTDRPCRLEACPGTGMAGRPATPAPPPAGSTTTRPHGNLPHLEKTRPAARASYALAAGSRLDYLT
jgi:hypothetical protein